MKGRTWISAAVLLLLLSGTVEAQRPGDVVLVWTGSYVEDGVTRNVTGKCPVTGCVGDLIGCDASKKMILTKLTYSFVSEICDDSTDELPACNGRFTALVEECRGLKDIVYAGSLMTLNSAGEIRVCLDGGDCSGPALGSVIATGLVRTQKRSIVGTATMSGNSSMSRETRESFLFEGEQNRLGLWRTHVDDFVAQQTDGNNCGDGCAVMGVSIKDQKQ